MYDDKRELTRSVIEKIKQRTAREEMKDAVKIVKQLACGVVYEDAQGNEVYHKFRYKVGEVVAVAQPYKIAINEPDWAGILLCKDTAGWTNKMFVESRLMPHRVQITDIKVQRLQDISDEDCLLEGIVEYKNGTYGTLNNALFNGFGFSHKWFFFKPRTAFMFLINAISGKGTWVRNNYHVIYYFKLIKQTL